mgnify:CR=1 FL=1
MTTYIGRNTPARGWRLVWSLLFISAFVGYVVWSMSGWVGQMESWFLAAFFGFFATIEAVFFSSSSLKEPFLDALKALK